MGDGGGVGVSETGVSETVVSKTVVSKTSVSETGVSETGVSETGVSEGQSVGQRSGDGGGGSLNGNGLLVGGTLLPCLALLQARHGVTEGVGAAGDVGGVLDVLHGHLDLLDDGLDQVVAVSVGVASQAGVAVAMAVAETGVAQGEGNLRQW